MIRKKQTAPCPNYAVPPGETLLETIETLGMSQAELAQRTGRPKKTINEIIKGKAALTPETALQLERVLGVPSSFWNNLERNYRERVARLKEEKALRAQENWIRELPISLLVKEKYLPRKSSPVEKLQAFLNFFGVAGVKEWKARWMKPQAAYRKSAAFASAPVMVAAWLRMGEIQASKLPCAPYNPRSFRSTLDRILRLTTEPPEVFEPRMKDTCAMAGVAVVFVPEIRGTHVYGATRWLSPNKALIQLSLRGKSDDHLWFAFFHEAAHILLHGKKDVFIEQEGRPSNGGEPVSEKEKEADQFARDFLIPQQEYRAFVERGDCSLAAIQKFAEALRIAPGIVVGRLQHDKVIQFSRGNELKKRLQIAAK